MGVVVTGAAGFIGRVLVDALVRAGESVVAIDRVPGDNSRQLHDHDVARGGDHDEAGGGDHDEAGGGDHGAVGGRRVARVAADLVDDHPAVREALAGAAVVFHLAGCPGVRDQGPDVAYRRHRDNVLATRAVLDRVPLETPLVVTSSSSVYGGAVRGRASREDDPLRPRGGYAQSKVTAERLCATRLEAGGIVAITRPFTVVGEGQRPDMALARWIAAARACRPLTVLGSPARTRDITDVRDVARVLIALAERGVSGTVNVGTGTGHTLADLVATVSRVCGTDVSTHVVPADPVEVGATLADTRRLRNLVGFVPRTDLLDVVRRQAAAQDLAPDVAAAWAGEVAV